MSLHNNNNINCIWNTSTQLLPLVMSSVQNHCSLTHAASLLGNPSIWYDWRCSKKMKRITIRTWCFINARLLINVCSWQSLHDDPCYLCLQSPQYKQDWWLPTLSTKPTVQARLVTADPVYKAHSTSKTGDCQQSMTLSTKPIVQARLVTADRAWPCLQSPQYKQDWWLPTEHDPVYKAHSTSKLDWWLPTEHDPVYKAHSTSKLDWWLPTEHDPVYKAHSTNKTGDCWQSMTLSTKPTVQARLVTADRPWPCLQSPQYKQDWWLPTEHDPVYKAHSTSKTGDCRQSMTLSTKPTVQARLVTANRAWHCLQSPQ